MKKNFILSGSTLLIIALLYLFSSHLSASATEPRYGAGWTPVYLEFPDPHVLYVECIETNNPDDFCVPTGYDGPIQQ